MKTTNRIATLARDIAEAANHHAMMRSHGAVDKLLMSQVRDIVDAWCEMLLEGGDTAHRAKLRNVLYHWKRTHNRLVEDAYLNKPRRRPLTIA